ncbi:MAG: HPr family phosphocarrier protein [Oscillospiraceae bacterium]|nr:HPr family phosphocarrier protein [Oscillospiraceae bacterium]
MKTRVFQFAEKEFFHARPAGQFAFSAAKYQSMVMIFFGEEFADAKRAISLMRLSRLRGKPFELVIDGSDEEKAMEELSALLCQIFEN